MIHVNNVSRYYGAKRALKDVTFTVEKGDTMGILGPNGSGKTTLINILLGLLRAHQGSISIEGMEVWAHRSLLLPKVGAIIEIPRLYPFLNGRENLQIFSTFLNLENSTKKIEEVLEIVGLVDVGKLSFKNYSLGMKQRLGIALSLLNDPDILVFDEPTNGLDPEGIITVREIIQKLSHSGKTVILCSHLIHEVEKICDSVVILQNGSVIKSLSAGELQNRESLFHLSVDKDSYEKAVRYLSSQNGWEILLSNPDVYSFKIRIPDEKPSLVLQKVQSGGIVVEGFYKEHVPLEDLFMEAVKK